LVELYEKQEGIHRPKNAREELVKKIVRISSRLEKEMDSPSEAS
jgi:hypothetical protein